MKKVLFYSCAAFFLASCGQLADKYGRMACKCTDEIYEMTTQEEKNPGSFTNGEFSDAEQRSMQCMEKTNKRFKDLISEDDAKKGIKDNCPNTYKLLFPNG